MLRSVPRPRAALAAAALLLAVGCGGDNRSPVRGKVLFPDGTPLTGGTVGFRAADGADGPSINGDIQDDGTFELGTLQPGDGVAPGRYKARVNARSPGGERPKPVIDPKFEKYETSGLEFEVKPESNEFTITVTRPK